MSNLSVGDTVKLKIDVYFGRRGTKYVIRDYIRSRDRWLLEDLEGYEVEVERGADYLEKVSGPSEDEEE